MLPRAQHRFVITATLMIGAVLWSSVLGLLVSPDGSSGLSLLSAQIGVVGGVLAVAVAGLGVLGLGLIASAMGNPLGGVFAVSGSLCLLAAKGGPIDGWMMRSDLPHDYSGLMVEMLIWQVGVVVMLVAIQWLRSPVRAMWPALAYDDHLGVDIHIRFPQIQAWGAGVVCAVCATGVALLAVRTSDVGQVLGALFFSFAVGGVAAGLIFPRINPAGVLFGPALVALTAYAYMWLAFHHTEDVLAAWYRQQLPGVALALPVHYASAGVAGCASGLGLAQVIEASKLQALDASQA